MFPPAFFVASLLFPLFPLFSLTQESIFHAAIQEILRLRKLVPEDLKYPSVDPADLMEEVEGLSPFPAAMLSRNALSARKYPVAEKRGPDSIAQAVSGRFLFEFCMLLKLFVLLRCCVFYFYGLSLSLSCLSLAVCLVPR